VARPRCSVFVAVSLDGFIARRDGSIDWLRAVEAPGEDYGFARFFARVDALLLGRATWDVARGFDPWPYAGKRVAVLAHAPREARHGETFHAGDAAAVLDALGGEGLHHVYADGGSVISQLLAADRVDALTVSVIPVVLGDGLRLFQGPLPERRLVLESATPYPSGLVQLSYLAPRAA
jgi:dihydrofolate reductase